MGRPAGADPHRPGLIFPPLQHLIERPFTHFPQRQIGPNTDGFGLGLTLGALYVPCAGPVLAAIVLAVALVFNLPAMLQRAVPDYTTAMQNKLGANEIGRSLNPTPDTTPPGRGGVLPLSRGGVTVDGALSDCTSGSAELQQCGPAPALTGITGWLNTPDGKPLEDDSVGGKVILIDFWAYSCINCQRAIPAAPAPSP